MRLSLKPQTTTIFDYHYVTKVHNHWARETSNENACYRGLHSNLVWKSDFLDKISSTQVSPHPVEMRHKPLELFSPDESRHPSLVHLHQEDGVLSQEMDGLDLTLVSPAVENSLGSDAGFQP